MQPAPNSHQHLMMVNQQQQQMMAAQNHPNQHMLVGAPASHHANQHMLVGAPASHFNTHLPGGGTSAFPPPGKIRVDPRQVMAELIPHSNLMSQATTTPKNAGNFHHAPSVSSSSAAPRSKKLVPSLVPRDFVCPISSRIMDKPVLLTTGLVCDERSVQYDDEGFFTCPVTGTRLHMNTCIKQRMDSLKAGIDNFLLKAPNTKLMKVDNMHIYTSINSVLNQGTLEKEEAVLIKNALDQISQKRLEKKRQKEEENEMKKRQNEYEFEERKEAKRRKIEQKMALKQNQKQKVKMIIENCPPRIPTVKWQLHFHGLFTVDHRGHLTDMMNEEMLHFRIKGLQHQSDLNGLYEFTPRVHSHVSPFYQQLDKRAFIYFEQTKDGNDLTPSVVHKDSLKSISQNKWHGGFVILQNGKWMELDPNRKWVPIAEPHVIEWCLSSLHPWVWHPLIKRH